MNSLTKPILIVSSCLALAGAGGIASASVFDIQEIKSQPASRSLPMLRWYFSRGSHTFPTLAQISAGGFAYLAYSALPSSVTLTQALSTLASPQSKAFGFLMASVLSIGIAPVTALWMVPACNFPLIELNEKLGGSRSERSAKVEGAGSGSAENSVNGKGQASQFTDLSGPQTKTQREATPAEERQVQELLDKFTRINYVRAALLGAGGVVGLVTALA